MSAKVSPKVEFTPEEKDKLSYIDRLVQGPKEEVEKVLKELEARVKAEKDKLVIESRQAFLADLKTLVDKHQMGNIKLTLTTYPWEVTIKEMKRKGGKRVK